MKKPELKLVGEDGNAFNILGKARRVAKKANWSKDKIDKMTKEAISGDYDNVLQVMIKYFEVN
ncbi:MAG: hypothetical protein H8D45_06750 [Bacteroidetes bacterium]|nr:hypothetical protein [Bacteroidota bacterium]